MPTSDILEVWSYKSDGNKCTESTGHANKKPRKAGMAEC